MDGVSGHGWSSGMVDDRSLWSRGISWSRWSVSVSVRLCHNCGDQAQEDDDLKKRFGISSPPLQCQIALGLKTYLHFEKRVKIGRIFLKFSDGRWTSGG